MVDPIEAIERLKGLLRRAIEGQAVALDELMRLSEAQLGIQAAQAWHQLSHWIADKDIRGRDAAYEADQRRELLLALESLS